MLSVDVRLTRGDFELQVALQARPGVLALFGRSGCGKTTTVNLLAGLLRGAQGRIALDDEVWLDSSRGIDVAAERRRIGYVFQDARLFPHYDVRGNLDYGRRRAHARGSAAPSFDDIVALLGLASLLDRRPAGLSGGERQRVALGRALLAHPRLLLLDEPLASLDVARRDEVLPWLEKLRDASGVPMVLVSHQFDEVLRLATEIAVLDAGRVVLHGSPTEVSLAPALRHVVGPDAVGAVLGGPVLSVDAGSGLARIAVGQSTLTIGLPGARVGEQRHVQLLARDVIVAVHEPRGLSVRNTLSGRIAQIVSEGDDDLVQIDVGAGALLLARVTRQAREELGLRPELPVWALVKAVSTRGHTY
ncbi:MAG: molybdenum ABC transporter ATP-binding protein [Steroidobacteraceae bacterium]